jgi:arginyl-tRNA--protein-N-Asp/Glu arginylyltransferase
LLTSTAVKLLFSETAPDYSRYLYPYIIWGFLEAGETPADAFNAGFLPGNPQMDRFYLVRNLRVPLAEWRPSSENRRILRKGSSIRMKLVPKAQFADTPERRTRWMAYADDRFGPGIMHPERLDRLLAGPVISHLLHFTETNPDGSERELGTVLLHIEAPRVVYYYYAFYDLADRGRNLGMILMTRAVEWAAREGFAHLHLGTCITPKARYKLQFEPIEFFNGMQWSRNLDELRWLLDSPPPASHQLECPDFLAFQPHPLHELARTSPFTHAPAAVATSPRPPATSLPASQSGTGCTAAPAP